MDGNDPEGMTLSGLADVLSDTRVVISSLVSLVVGAGLVLTWLVVITDTPTTADRALETAQENRQVLTDLGYAFRVVLCTSDDEDQGLTERGRELLQCDQLGQSRPLFPSRSGIQRFDTISISPKRSSILGSPLEVLQNRIGAAVALRRALAVGKARTGPRS